MNGQPEEGFILQKTDELVLRVMGNKKEEWLTFTEVGNVFKER